VDDLDTEILNQIVDGVVFETRPLKTEINETRFECYYNALKCIPIYLQKNFMGSVYDLLMRHILLPLIYFQAVG
jgi:hypothetical protein